VNAVDRRLFIGRSSPVENMPERNPLASRLSRIKTQMSEIEALLLGPLSEKELREALDKLAEYQELIAEAEEKLRSMQHG
jgi:hypothetical protein